MPKKYVLALIIITVVFFGGIFLLVRLISGNLGGNDNKKENTAIVQKVNDLSDSGRKVTYTVYGRVLGEENRRTIRITVSDNERLLEVLGGYDESIVRSERTSNKSSAFENFLLALETANYTRRDTSIKTDDRGLCPLGNRYVFEAEYEDTSSMRSFSNSCGTKGVSFKGNRLTVDTLFKAQIPRYTELTKDVIL